METPARGLLCRLSAFFLGAICAAASLAFAEEEHVLAILALRPKAQTVAAHLPLARYLEGQLPGHRFVPRAYGRDELRIAAARGEFAFAIVNPDLYAELERRHGARVLATRIGEESGKATMEFAGVIFARADRHDIARLADLKGKRIAAVAPDAFGGFLIQGAELVDAGIDPIADIVPLYLGLPQDKVVDAVASGQADAGCVRSGVLEALAAEGRIRLADFKPLAAKNGRYPHWHSTPTYPEWPFVAMPTVTDALAKKLAIALLSLPADHPAARASKGFGWGVAANYAPVHEVLRKMRAPPYDAPPPFGWRDVLHCYDLPIFGFLLTVVALFAGLAWRNVRLRRAVEQDQQQLRLAAAVFANAREGMVITDAEGIIVDVNTAFTEVTGYARAEALGNNPRLLKSGRHDAAFYAEMWRQLLATGRWRGEIWNRRKDGTIYPELLSIAAVLDPKGRTTHYIGNFLDISELKAAEEKLRQLAHFDPLTGLPNRALLMDRLRLGLKQTQRRERLLAVCFLDLDGFKPINDRFGHDAGDRVLVEIARRLSVSLRSGDTVARIGGDEFVLLLVDLATVAELEQILSRLFATLHEPLVVATEKTSVGASIGVTLYPLDDTDPDGLLRHADHAMYRAKQTGRGRYEIFDPTSLADRDR